MLLLMLLLVIDVTLDKDPCPKFIVDELLRNKNELLEEKKEYTAPVKGSCVEEAKATSKLCILFDAPNLIKDNSTIILNDKVVIATGPCPKDKVKSCAGQARAQADTQEETTTTTTENKDDESTTASSQQGALRSLSVSFVCLFVLLSHTRTHTAEGLTLEQARTLLR